MSTSFLTFDLIQSSPNPETVLGSCTISLNDLLSQRKTWWEIKSSNNSIALIFLEIFLYTSPPTSPGRATTQGPSFSIPQTPSRHPSQKEEDFASFLEKIKLDSSRLANEKSLLESISRNILKREKILQIEKNKIFEIFQENNSEKVKLRKMIENLDIQYFSLKHEKFFIQAQKILLEKKSKKLKISEKKLQDLKKSVNRSSFSEIFRKVQHPVIHMSESVKPVFHEPDSPPESPLFTQDSSDQTVTTLN
jgi:hypothetical protein